MIQIIAVNSGESQICGNDYLNAEIFKTNGFGALTE
jgi:hypothetical protein